jgi:hypothetical protein
MYKLDFDGRDLAQLREAEVTRLRHVPSELSGGH